MIVHEETRLASILAFVDSHVKFAETKNAALLAAAAAAIIGIMQVLNGDHPPTGWTRLYLLVVCSAATIAAVITLLSFLPATQIPWLRRARKRYLGGNLLFFGDAQRYDATAYIEALLTATGSARRAPSAFEEMYAGQIIANAKIAARKFTYFKIALWTILGGILTPPVALVLLVVVADKDL